MHEEIPSSKQFRINELDGILSDLAKVVERAKKHRAYLTDPILEATHESDCRDHDVAVTNLTLAIGSLEDADRQLALARKVTAIPAPAPEEQPES